jgi:hypothetical protein
MKYLEEIGKEMNFFKDINPLYDLRYVKGKFNLNNSQERKLEVAYQVLFLGHTKHIIRGSLFGALAGTAMSKIFGYEIDYLNFIALGAAFLDEFLFYGRAIHYKNKELGRQKNLNLKI